MMIKRVYEVNIGKVYVLANSDEEAKIGACSYVGGDMGIENLTTKMVSDNKEYDYEQ